MQRGNVKLPDAEEAFGRSDRLYGGAGNDFLYGGRGDNHLYGGAGYDIAYLPTLPEFVESVTKSGDVTVVTYFSSTAVDYLYDVEEIGYRLPGA